MREVFGADLFTYPADALVVPINWTTKKNGEAVMGAGVAKQAAERWPDLPRRLGITIHFAAGPMPLRKVMSVDGRHLVLFPTKGDWRKPARLDYIEVGAPVLMRLADYWGYKTVALPRLGCGERTGRLSWPDQVRPLLAVLLDDRFVVVSREPRP